MAGNFLLEGRLRKKAEILSRSPDVLLFVSVFVLYLAGLFYSENFSHALVRIKNALPLLVIPVVVAGSEYPNKKFIGILSNLFILSVAIAVVINVLTYLNYSTTHANRESISLFMSHIPFSIDNTSFADS